MQKVIKIVPNFWDNKIKTQLFWDMPVGWTDKTINRYVIYILFKENRLHTRARARELYYCCATFSALSVGHLYLVC